MTLAEIRAAYAEMALAFGCCRCGVGRRPERRLIGAVAVLLCGRCGKRTTDRKGD